MALAGSDPVPTPALLDTLPVTNLDLARLPDLQALALFDAFRLEIHYDRPGTAPGAGSR